MRRKTLSRKAPCPAVGEACLDQMLQNRLRRPVARFIPDSPGWCSQYGSVSCVATIESSFFNPRASVSSGWSELPQPPSYLYNVGVADLVAFPVGGWAAFPCPILASVSPSLNRTLTTECFWGPGRYLMYVVATIVPSGSPSSPG